MDGEASQLLTIAPRQKEQKSSEKQKKKIIIHPDYKREGMNHLIGETRLISCEHEM